LELDIFGNGLATREKGDVVQNTFALISEARCPNGGNMQIATRYAAANCW
jgi:hypothetical protein